MEQWEIDYRAKLEAELPEGPYNISSGNIKMFTGKRGMIDLYVVMATEGRKRSEAIRYIPIENKYKYPYKKLTYKQVEDIIKEFFTLK